MVCMEIMLPAGIWEQLHKQLLTSLSHQLNVIWDCHVMGYWQSGCHVIYSVWVGMSYDNLFTVWPSECHVIVLSLTYSEKTNNKKNLKIMQSWNVHYLFCLTSVLCHCCITMAGICMLSAHWLGLFTKTSVRWVSGAHLASCPGSPLSCRTAGCQLLNRLS